MNLKLWQQLMLVTLLVVAPCTTARQSRRIKDPYGQRYIRGLKGSVPTDVSHHGMIDNKAGDKRNGIKSSENDSSDYAVPELVSKDDDNESEYLSAGSSKMSAQSKPKDTSSGMISKDKSSMTGNTSASSKASTSGMKGNTMGEMAGSGMFAMNSESAPSSKASTSSKAAIATSKKGSKGSAESMNSKLSYTTSKTSNLDSSKGGSKSSSKTIAAKKSKTSSEKGGNMDKVTYHMSKSSPPKGSKGESKAHTAKSGMMMKDASGKGVKLAKKMTEKSGTTMMMYSKDGKQSSKGSVVAASTSAMKASKAKKSSQKLTTSVEESAFMDSEDEMSSADDEYFSDAPTSSSPDEPMFPPTGTNAPVDTESPVAETPPPFTEPPVETDSPVEETPPPVTEPPLDTEPPEETEPPTEEELRTIVDIAVGNPDFSTLVELLTQANLVDVLSSDGPFTVFAPTNDAFASVDPAILDAIASDAGLLTSVLLYHVVEGTVLSTDLTDEAQVSTVNGENVTTFTDPPMVNDANIVTADIIASNGVIHVIDAVLVPPAEEETDPPVQETPPPVTELPVETELPSETTDSPLETTDAPNTDPPLEVTDAPDTDSPEELPSEETDAPVIDPPTETTDSPEIDPPAEVTNAPLETPAPTNAATDFPEGTSPPTNAATETEVVDETTAPPGEVTAAPTTGDLFTPENDICVDAIVLEVGDTVSGNTAFASEDSDVETCDDALFSDASSIELLGLWYAVEATDTRLRASVCSDTGNDLVPKVVTIYGGGDNCADLRCAPVYNTAGCTVDWVASSDFEMYYILVQSLVVEGAPLDVEIDLAFELVVSEAPAARNGVCEDAITLEFGDTVAGQTLSAPEKNFEGSCALELQPPSSNVLIPGVWYSVVGTGSSITAGFTASTCNENSGPILVTIYSGSCDALQCQTFEVGNEGPCAAQIDSTVEGETYYILVEKVLRGDDKGNFELQVQASS